MVHKTIKRLVFVSFILTGIQACYFDNELELYGETECDTTSVTFSDDVEFIISANCATSGCHVSGGTGNGNFETYAGINQKVQNGSFEQRVIVEQSMPPDGFLSECDIQVLQQWLNDGAPNN